MPVGHLHFLFGKMSLQFFCPFLFFFYKFILFLFISGCVGSLLLRRLSLAAASRGYCLSQLRASHFGGFSCCGAWALGARASVVAARGLSLVGASRGYSSLWCAGFSLQWLLLLQSTDSRCAASLVMARRLSSCGSRALERRLSSCGARA